MAKIVFPTTSTSMFYADDSNTTYLLKADSEIHIAGLDKAWSFGILEDPDQHHNRFVINGDITIDAGYGVGVQVQGDYSSVVVGKQSTIDGYQGVNVRGKDVSATNNGFIMADAYGMVAGSDNAELVNNGGILASNAIMAQGRGTHIINGADGEILAAVGVNLSVVNQSDKQGVITIENHGALIGTQHAVKGSFFGINLINDGTITGLVQLSNTNDRVDTRGGVINDDIQGWLGDDTVITDSATTKFVEYGGMGFDTLKSTVTNTLAVNVERLILIGNSAIDATGNTGDNTLIGNAAANHLFAQDGNDILRGGKGNDELSGGIGADRYIFRHGDGKDAIVDFSDGQDLIDLRGYKGIDDFADIEGHMHESGNKVIITLDDGDRISVANMTMALMTEADFLF